MGCSTKASIEPSPILSQQRNTVLVTFKSHRRCEFQMSLHVSPTFMSHWLVHPSSLYVLSSHSTIKQASFPTKLSPPPIRPVSSVGHLQDRFQHTPFRRCCVERSPPQRSARAKFDGPGIDCNDPTSSHRTPRFSVGCSIETIASSSCLDEYAGTGKHLIRNLLMQGPSVRAVGSGHGTSGSLVQMQGCFWEGNEA